MSTITTTPVAPRVGEQGTSRPGGHYQAYKAQPAFALDATLELISGSNPWRPASPGSEFWGAVLSKLQGKATVATAIAMAKESKVATASEVQKHLRWLYTWGGAYLRVNGSVFIPPVPAPKAPRAKAPAKAKAS